MAKPVFRNIRLDQLVLPRRGIRTGRRKHGELVGSIDELGVLVPLVVRKVGKKYEVVAGAGRLEAVRQLDAAGTTMVPCVVVDVDDAEATLLALVENIVREDMVPFDKAKTARVLVKEDGFTQERVARALGMTPPTVSGWLAVFELDRSVVAALERGIIQMRSALALLPLRDDKKAQRADAERGAQHGADGCVGDGAHASRRHGASALRGEGRRACRCEDHAIGEAAGRARGG